MPRAFIRTVFIVLLTACAMIATSSDVSLLWHPYGTFGVGLDARGMVKRVDPYAARAGLRLGDTVDVARLSPADRHELRTLAPPDRIIDVPLTTGPTVRLKAHVVPRTPLANLTMLMEVLSSLGYIALAAALVLIRPTPATWAFYVFSYSFCMFAATPNVWPVTFLAPSAALLNLAAIASPVAFISFALRFPDTQPHGVAKAFERILLYALGPVLAGWAVFESMGSLLFPSALPRWAGTAAITAVPVDAMFAAGIAILIARYVNAGAADRNRLQWVVAAFAVAFLPFLVLRFLWVENFIEPSAVAINLCMAWEVLAPIALAYTVLRHRLFDIRLIFSRALMYALMMSFIVGALALVDWAFSRWLQETRFAMFAELGLALLLGAGLTIVHGRIEYVLNAVIFREQKLALRALRRFALEADLIPDPQRLLSQTYEALHGRLETDDVGLYTADGSSFALATQNGNATPPLLAGDDFAVLRLRRWSEPFECDEPAHPLRGALFVPMTARTQLVGFIVCGPKRDRTHYLPEEIETLATLAHRIGSAYAWLTLASAAPRIGRVNTAEI